MARLTKFTLSPTGELVYKSTGKLAPAGYHFRKNTVYGPNGRRVGSLSRKLTKTEASKIAKAQKSRNRRLARQASKPSQGRPKAPSQKAARAGGAMAYGEDWDAIDTTEFPEAAAAIKEEFAQRVRDAAVSVAPEWLAKRIRAFTTDALWRGYEENAYIFELYFKYHNPVDAPHPSDASMWLYQFVTRIEQYMGVDV